MSLEPMFTSVAKKYDLTNRIITLTLDEKWRETCARQCRSKGTVVDLCCGTGDLTFRILKHVPPETNVIGLDFSKAMLAGAVNKKRTCGNPFNPTFILADATHLPFNSRSIDCVETSFSLRNLTYKNPKAKEVLKEVLRSLKLNGRFVCVETSQPKTRVLMVLFHLYLLKVVPLVGWLVSRRKSAYRYLAMSAINFASAEVVANMLLNAGFSKVSFKHLAFGIIALHVGLK